MISIIPLLALLAILKADRIHAKLAALRSKYSSASGVRPKFIAAWNVKTKKHYITINPTHILTEFTTVPAHFGGLSVSAFQGFDRLKEDFCTFANLSIGS